MNIDNIRMVAGIGGLFFLIGVAELGKSRVMQKSALVQRTNGSTGVIDEATLAQDCFLTGVLFSTMGVLLIVACSIQTLTGFKIL